MAIKDSLLPEFDREVATTRKCLERVPFAKADWKPHPKSFTLGSLAAFTALLAGWGTSILGQDFFDFAPPSGPPAKMPELKSSAELLAFFDKGVSECRQLLKQTSDEKFMQTWSLKQAGKTLMTLPRIAMFRNMVLNHMIHHRGQLTVYLRMCNVPVPAIYGPSGDDPSWS